MADLPDLSLDAASRFLQVAGLIVDRADGALVEAHLDAGPEHHTPWGVVHGGLSATVIESACSIGASFAVSELGQFAVGLSNSTEFLRAHREGRIQVRATPVFQGRSGQVWQCDLSREDGKLVAQGRVRLQNVPLP